MRTGRWSGIVSLAVLGCLTKTTPGTGAPADGGSDVGSLESSEPEAGRSACSTGPAHGDQSFFGYERGSLPAEKCVPRCDYSVGDRPPPRVGVYRDGIPSGACSVRLERCFIYVDHLCIPAFDQVETFRCECIDEQWTCLRTGEPPASPCTGR